MQWSHLFGAMATRTVRMRVQLRYNFGGAHRAARRRLGAYIFRFVDGELTRLPARRRFSRAACDLVRYREV